MAFAVLVLSAVVIAAVSVALVYGMNRKKAEMPHDEVETAARLCPPSEASSGGGAPCQSEPVVTNDAPVVTNEDAAVTTSAIPDAEIIVPPVATNVPPAVTNAMPAVANSLPAVTNLPSKKANGALVAACEKHGIDAFAAAIRKRLPADKRLEFAEQVKRLSSSARDCARMKTEKAAQRMSVDLKYVLLSSHAVREALPTTGTGAVALARAWDVAEKGDGDPATLQRACAEVLMRVRDELK